MKEVNKQSLLKEIPLTYMQTEQIILNINIGEGDDAINIDNDGVNNINLSKGSDNIISSGKSSDSY